MLKDNGGSKKNPSSTAEALRKGTAQLSSISQNLMYREPKPTGQPYNSVKLKYLGFECIMFAPRPGSVMPKKKISSPWVFDSYAYCLCRNGVRIELTETENQVIDQFVSTGKRVLGKDELVKGINKDPDTYTGLEMCLSRLQYKFKKSTMGKRLIRSVRNKGYCLAQKIEPPDSPVLG